MTKVANVQALHIAEAGVDYYRWVLYHAHQEYCNHETCKPGPTYGPYGPYAYTDFDGTITGYYELYITPPQINGSTIVDIKSVGWEAKHPAITRTIEVRCGIPSWSSFSTLANSAIRFGTGTEVFGPIFDNQGIRFDGLAHNTVTSAATTYQDPDHTNGPEFAVHTHIWPVGSGLVDDTYRANEAPPNAATTTIRNDVFLAGRSVGAATILFNLLNVNSLIAMATSSCGTTTCGMLFDPRPASTADASSVPAYQNCISSNPSCSQGYHITLNTNNTFSIKRVSAVYAQCSDVNFNTVNSDSIQTEDAAATTYNIPANGIIFVEETSG